MVPMTSARVNDDADFSEKDAAAAKVGVVSTRSRAHAILLSREEKFPKPQTDNKRNACVYLCQCVQVCRRMTVWLDVSIDGCAAYSARLLS